jgi:D-alanine--poly(phosphoribitol) ligase subunit 2
MNGALKEQIRSLFVQQMSVDVPSHETDLLEAGLLDSMGLVDLLMHIEKAFGITIGLEDLDVEDFRSVNSIAAVVGVRIEAKNARA